MKREFRPSREPVFLAPPREKPAAKKKVSITLNDRKVEVDDGLTILEAARGLAPEIPHYCYHPGLPIAGNCRMCLVEVAGPQRSALAISCSARVAEGMVVKTESPMVKEARAGVLEFLLLNHPLDCPICDQAGECGLQIFYMKHDARVSRLKTDKVEKDKVVKLGPNVMLDQERCILCTRCIRFCDEITKTSELCLSQRGDHARITSFPGRPLDNPYSVCTTDICPVGALTSREFRFSERVWFLAGADSICTGCSRGCSVSLQYHKNVTFDELNHKAFRLLPRYNPRVNDWWMCDEGRLSFRRCNESRALVPFVRAEKGGAPSVAAWPEALREAARLIRSFPAGAVAALASPQASTEELFLFRKLATETIGAARFSARSSKKPGFQDEFLIRADKNPNGAGAELVGAGEDPRALLADVAPGRIRCLVLFDADPVGDSENDAAVREAIARAETVIAIGPNDTESTAGAAVLLPTASVAEKEGTFVNCDGRVQRFARAFPPPKGVFDALDVLTALARALGAAWPARSAEAVFGEMAAAIPDLAGLTYASLLPHGAVVASRAPREPGAAAGAAARPGAAER